MHTFILQDWTTIQGAASMTVTQHESEWLDLGPYQDVVFWVDVRNAAASPTLTLQTSPTKDDSFFQAIVTGFPIAGSATPTVVSAFMTAAPVPLARYVRWQLTSGSAWNATFRIVVAANSPGL